VPIDVDDGVQWVREPAPAPDPPAEQTLVAKLVRA